MGDLPFYVLPTVVIEDMFQTTLLSVSQACRDSTMCGIFAAVDCRFYKLESILHFLTLISERGVETMRGTAKNCLCVQESNWLRRTERLLVASAQGPSIYDNVHRVLGHPGEEGMQWHRMHTTGAAYARADAAKPRPLCRACVEGTMRILDSQGGQRHNPRDLGILFLFESI
jgi:hypothetical protein